MNDILDEDFIGKEEQITYKKWPFIVWSSILIIGVLFRLLHWPGGSLFTIVSSGVISGYSFSLFLKLNRKNIYINILSIISSIWIIFIISDYFFNNKSLYSLYGLSIYGGILISSLIFYKALFYARNKKNSNNYWL